MTEENSSSKKFDPAGRYLLLDASGPLVQTALWQSGKWLRWTGSREEAGKSLFSGTREILKSEKTGFEDLNGFLFCEGPGSMLGIRIAAMAIRGWQSTVDFHLPVFSYQSLFLLAKILLKQETKPPFHLISDARRKRWNLVSVLPGGKIAPLSRLTAGELEKLQGPFFRMEESFIRSEPPKPAKIISYNLKNHASLFLDKDLPAYSETAEPFLGEEPQYQKWQKRRHR